MRHHWALGSVARRSARYPTSLNQHRFLGSSRLLRSSLMMPPLALVRTLPRRALCDAPNDWLFIPTRHWLTSTAALLFNSTIGQRYESYTLMQVGHGIQDRSTS